MVLVCTLHFHLSIVMAKCKTKILILSWLSLHATLATLLSKYDSHQGSGVWQWLANWQCGGCLIIAPPLHPPDMWGMFDNAQKVVQFLTTLPAFKQVEIRTCVCLQRLHWRAVGLTKILKTTKLTNVPIWHGCLNAYHPSPISPSIVLPILHIAYMSAHPSPRDVSTSSTHFILLPTRDCCPCHRYLAHADMNNVNMFCFGLLLLALLCLSNIVIEWLHWE